MLFYSQYLVTSVHTVASKYRLSDFLNTVPKRWYLSNPPSPELQELPGHISKLVWQIKRIYSSYGIPLSDEANERMSPDNSESKSRINLKRKANRCGEKGLACGGISGKFLPSLTVYQTLSLLLLLHVLVAPPRPLFLTLCLRHATWLGTEVMKEERRAKRRRRRSTLWPGNVPVRENMAIKGLCFHSKAVMSLRRYPLLLLPFHWHCYFSWNDLFETMQPSTEESRSFMDSFCPSKAFLCAQGTLHSQEVKAFVTFLTSKIWTNMFVYSYELYYSMHGS